MRIKLAAAGVIAAVTVMICTVYAENETYTDGEYQNDYSQAVTEAPTNYDEYDTQSEGSTDQQDILTSQETTVSSEWDIQTTTTTTTQPYIPEPTAEPAKVFLDVGEVKDGKFSVKLKIKSDSPVTNASVSVSYDDSLIEYESSKQNEKVGGMAVENCFEGKFVYNYVNKDGTDFDGTYTTLKFNVLDEDMISTVLYLSVTSLDDDSLRPIAFYTENGIVENAEAETEASSVADSEFKELKIAMSKEPVSAESLGLEDVKSCTVENGEVLIFEDGAFQTLETGKTVITVMYGDGSEERFLVTVSSENVVSESSSAESETPAESVEPPAKSENSFRNALICVAVILAIIALIIEYIVIFRPFGSKIKSPDEDNVEDDDNGSEQEVMTSEGGDSEERDID